jgi:hypothetical protein
MKTIDSVKKRTGNENIMHLPARAAVKSIMLQKITKD